MKRHFMRCLGGRPEAISNTTHHVTFTFPEDGGDGIQRQAIGHRGEDRNHCPWGFRDAMSHVGTGTWIEVLQDESGAWYAPTFDQLAAAARERTRDQDVPQTVVEDAW